MAQDSHTGCSILVNVPITFAFENLWELLHEENKWTQGSKISKQSAGQIQRNITTAEIYVRQKIKKIVEQRKISFGNLSGNLRGSYWYYLQQNGKGQVILNYESSAMRNGLWWPPQYTVEQQLIQLKNTLQYRHHGPKSQKKGFFC